MNSVGFTFCIICIEQVTGQATLGRVNERSGMTLKTARCCFTARLVGRQRLRCCLTGIGAAR